MLGALRRLIGGRGPAPALPDLSAIVVWHHPKAFLIQPHYITLREDLAPSGELGFPPDPALRLGPDADDAALGAACLGGLAQSRPLDPQNSSDLALIDTLMSPQSYAAYSGLLRAALGLGDKAVLYKAMVGASLRCSEGRMRVQRMVPEGQGGFAAQDDPQIHPRMDDPAALGAWVRSFLS